MLKAYATPAGNPPADIARLRQLVLGTGGRFFSVLFVKRGTCEPRRMLARLKRLGAETVASDRWNSQLRVFDCQKREWRCLPLERVVFFKCGAVNWVTSV